MRAPETPEDVGRRTLVRTFHHSAFSSDQVARERTATVSVCLPARNEASTIGAILDELLPLIQLGVVDEVVVVDDSEDDTAEIARGRGAKVYRQSALCSELGPVQGKGDAMWRALSVLQGEVICYLDADSERFGSHYATALSGVVAIPGKIRFAKACYRRPFRTGGIVQPTGGGRATQLTALPLIKAFYPSLTGFAQPLAGEFAAERSLLLGLPFLCGYAVDLPLLIDAWKAVGLEGLAQVDLDVRQNRHRPLSDLSLLADSVMAGVLARVWAEGRLRGPFSAESLQLVERPPMNSYRPHSEHQVINPELQENDSSRRD